MNLRPRAPERMSNSIEHAAWQALRLRATTFLLADFDIDDTSVWSTVIGGVPDEEQRRPREGLLQQIGTLAGLTVVLRIVHPRVDWFLHPQIQDPTAPSMLPDWQVFSFSDELKTLLEMASQWFSMQMSASRVAFGANLVQPADNLRDAHLRLTRYLGNLTIDPDNSFDLFYQINRRRTSGVIPQLTVNRLSKWSVMTQSTGSVVVQQPIQGVPQTSLSAPVTQQLASSLELDINTVPVDEQRFEQSQLYKLFSELVDWGREIAEVGDIA